jgi:hypothetical protein
MGEKLYENSKRETGIRNNPILLYFYKCSTSLWGVGTTLYFMDEENKAQQGYRNLLDVPQLM